MHVGPLGRHTWESPHHYGAIGTALSEKARGCDRGQRCGCRRNVLRASGAREGVCQGNGTLHEGKQTKMASPSPLPPQVLGKRREGVGEEDTGRRVGVRGQPRSGKEKRLVVGKPKATPGVRKVMSGRDALTWGGDGRTPKPPRDRDALRKEPQAQRHHQGQGWRRPQGAPPDRAGIHRAGRTSGPDTGVPWEWESREGPGLGNRCQGGGKAAI